MGELLIRVLPLMLLVSFTNGFQTCGGNVVGRMDENMINMIDNITSEISCQKLCSETANCKLYTYYLENDPHYHQLCVLLTELLPPFEPSNSASTGPADCYSTAECFFIGDSPKSVMVTEDEVEVTVSAIGSCELTILAVGGGGMGAHYGGGSGFLQYQKIRVSNGITSLYVVAGASAQPSSVTFTYSGISIVANPGLRGDGIYGGGMGYSGGGAGRYNSGYSGGSNGSDGEGPDGGQGSHVDISEYIFTTWTLTPGDGGSAWTSDSGGGGGVMVNSEGPGTDKYKGQGYGGGGNGQISHNIGHPGLVLLEISSGSG